MLKREVGGYKAGTGQLQAYVAGRAKTVKPDTARNEVTVIKLLFKYATKWNYISHNPTDHLERPKIDKPEIEILSPWEFDLFIREVEMPYTTAFLTAFLTGVRADELWGLQRGDIDWNSKQIHVKRSLWNHQFQKPKTKTAVRKIEMTERLIIHAGQNIKHIHCQLGHASINMTLDVYGHLFNDLDFNRKQVGLLESFRNPLEKPSELQYAAV